MKKRKGLGNRLTNKRYPLYFAVPALGFYTLFIIAPFIISTFLSFTDWNIERMYHPVFRALDNYAIIFKDAVFIRSILNTLLFASLTTVLKTLFGLILAILLVKSSKLNNVLRTIYYVPCVLSPLIIGVIFTSILANQGLLNHLLSAIGLSGLAVNWLASYGSAMGSVILIEGWMWSGFNMFIFIAGIQAIPQDYYESASIEGASGWKKFKNITLPLLVPSFTVIITLNITGGLKVFDLIYVLTKGGPGFDTQVLSTFVYKAFGLGLLGQSSAASVILSVLVVAISFVLNRILSKKEVEL